MATQGGAFALQWRFTGKSESMSKSVSMSMSLSLSKIDEGLWLYLSILLVVLFHLECCIRQTALVSSSSVILYNITIIAYDPHTDISPLLSFKHTNTYKHINI